MDNSSKYGHFDNDMLRLPSVMGIISKDVQLNLDGELVEKLLSQSPHFKLLSLTEDKDANDYALNSFFANIEYQSTEFKVELNVCYLKELNLEEFNFANAIDQESIDEAMQQEYYLETSLFFELDPLSSFHLQLKILDAIVPKASLAIDFTSYRLLSAKWLHLAASSSTPPSPDYLYIIHAVHDEDEDTGLRKYWLHTHGLQRCGSIELEMLNFTQGVEQMYTLLNMTVKKFLTSPTREREKFAIGYDGMGIDISWLRWEEALKDFPELSLGGFSDREGEDNVHAGASGVLFAVEDGNMVSPEIYVSTLAENPIYYITTEETLRMSELAKERFNVFEKIFHREHKTPEKKSFLKGLFRLKEDDSTPQWTFLVKLGLVVDDANSETEREHLWFEVLSISKDLIKGKLLNQPYWISGLNEGDVNEYPLEMLTDWIIYSPDNTYSPDSSYLLED